MSSSRAFGRFGCRPYSSNLQPWNKGSRYSSFGERRPARSVQCTEYSIRAWLAEQDCRWNASRKDGHNWSLHE